MKIEHHHNLQTKILQCNKTTNFLSFTAVFVFTGVIHWHFNYCSFSTAYLCDHWLL